MLMDDLATFNGKTVLVFGGDGFIGSNFIRALFKASPNVKVINGDARTYSGNPNNLADIRARYQASDNDTGQLYELHGSIADPEFVKACFGSKPDYVINFAAETHVDRSIHVGAKEFIDTNVTGVFNILEAVKAAKDTLNPVERYVQVSTDEVYGQLPNPHDAVRNAEECTGFGTDCVDKLTKKHYHVGKGKVAMTEKQIVDNVMEKKFTEETPFKPNVPYSATKAGGDALCNAYYHTWGVPVCVTHCSNNYGPYQYPEKMIPFWAMCLLNGGTIPVYGDGLNIRDWIHVEDHITALGAVLARGKDGETYNVGADNERTNLEMVGFMAQILTPGKAAKVEYVKDRPGHDRRYAIDHSKITRELGWTPKIGPDEFPAALKETLEWYATNTAWTAEVIERTGVANPHIDLWKAHNL